MIQIDKLKTISLSALLESEQKSGEVKLFLSTFICKKNKDVQNYLHNNAIQSEKRLFSKTTLVINDENKIVGFFTLLTNTFHFTDDVSGRTRQRLTNNKEAPSFVAVLIAQIGRSDSFKDEVEGSIILNLALETCQAIKDLSALRIVCVEHDSNMQLNKFYEDNEFKLLQINDNNKIMRFVRL